MDFKQHFERSWQVMLGNFAPILVNTLVMFVVSVVSLGIMAPVVSAGYMQSLLLALRENKKPDVKDLFAHMDLFFPLLGFAALFVFLVVIGMIMLVLPGIAVILAGTFFLVYMLPLMTDQRLGLIEAVKESSRMALDDPIAEHIAVVAVLIILDSIGSSIVFGTLLTHPYACLFILSVYEAKRRRQITGSKSAPPPPPKNDAGAEM
ncbi:Glycerophosphoryl diester phosphodiesterase membrane domain-containing protein [Candidatus Electrothrix laxa]